MDAFFIPGILCEGLNKVNKKLLPGNFYYGLCYWTVWYQFAQNE